MMGEFEGVMMYATLDNRPVTSPPPAVIATTRFIREVREALHIADDDAARVAADWIITKMERFGARSARGVFDMKGQGPMCSWCGVMWPLCGHHHLSEAIEDEDADPT